VYIFPTPPSFSHSMGQCSTTQLERGEDNKARAVFATTTSTIDIVSPKSANNSKNDRIESEASADIDTGAGTKFSNTNKTAFTPENKVETQNRDETSEERGGNDPNKNTQNTPLISAAANAKMDMSGAANMLRAVRQNVIDPFMQATVPTEGGNANSGGEPMIVMNHHTQNAATPIGTNVASSTRNATSTGGANSSGKRIYGNNQEIQRSYSGEGGASNKKREEERNEQPRREIPLPPEGAVRMRCYRLNLDAERGVSSPGRGSHKSRDRIWNTLPAVQPSCSDDEGNNTTEEKMAESVAKIFRGLVVNRDGTITSGRKGSRSATKGKVDEKSRQAAKIDRAKDLVEEAMKGNSKKKLDGEEGGDDDDTETKMISLVVVGEYDDMKYLVRDGSKKLKEAQGLPDEALLNLNRPRSSGSSSRRRGDTNSSGQHHHHSSKSHHRGNSGAPPMTPTTPTRDRKRSQQHHPAGVEHVQNNTTPPKLNRHPRDRPSRREGGPKRFANVPDPCSDLFAGGDSDWSEALAFPKGLTSIWNCGATRDNNGTMSPHKQYENGGEGRDSGDKSTRNDDGLGREGNSVRKINSPERNEILVA